MTRARMPRPHEVAAARRDPRLIRAFSERELDPAWRTRGRCQTVDPEMFFPAPSEPPDNAIALCRTCDVQGSCLAWALEVGDCHGVWGGTTPRERRAMLVAWRADVPRLPLLPLLMDGPCQALLGDPQALLADSVVASDVLGGCSVGGHPVGGHPVERADVRGELVPASTA